MRRQYIALLIVATAPWANAENGTVSIPALGLVVDSASGAVRAVLGTPGAADIGTPVSLDFIPAGSAAAGETLMVVSSTDGTVHTVRLRGKELDVRSVEGTVVRPERIVLSASGKSALLCHKDRRSVQVVNGLPNSPVAGAQIQLPQGGGAGPWKLALSDDGTRIAAGTETLMWLLDSKGTQVLYPLRNAVSAVSFRPDSAEAVALLSDGELVRLGAGGAEHWAMIPATTSPDVVGLQMSADGRRAFAAFANGYLAVAEAGSDEGKLKSCECAPTGLTPTTRFGLYRLNEVSHSPMLLWDVWPSVQRVWFVPNGIAGEGQ